MTELELALKVLNPEQYAAVTYADGALLVLAGAGSGKTSVLTTRIAWLLAQHHLSPQRILAVTFTNKAATEMNHRVSKILSINTQYMWIGTFHAIASRMLRVNYLEACLPQAFHVIDSNEQLAIIKKLLKTMNLATDKYPPHNIQTYINKKKENCMRAMQALDSEKLPHKQQFAAVYMMYEAECSKNGLVDFAELLLRSYELLLNNIEILQHYQQQFRYLLVDEFQDTNFIQYCWLKLLSVHNNIFAVGDDDQSIYSFRGALSSNVTSLLHDFKIQAPIRLEQNYRSTPIILAAANAVIANNEERIGKNLWTEQIQTDKISIYQAYCEADEARFVCDTIIEMLAGDSTAGNIAVLYRSNAQSRIIEQTLYAAGIAYKLTGGFGFFERQEVKLILAYCRLIVNSADDVAFLRVVNTPARLIGQKTLDKLQTIANTHKLSLLQTCKHNLAPKKLKIFTKIMQQISEFATNNTNLDQFMAMLLDATGINKLYAEDPIAEERLKNIDELLNAMKSFTNFTNQQHIKIADWLGLFLNDTTLSSHEKSGKELVNAVNLMTVHAAKGLEFRVVFVIGLENGLFPYIKYQNINIEEERRLMYVAITRAKQYLFLSYCRTRTLWGQEMCNEPSDFLDEIPGHLIQYMNTRHITRKKYY